MNATCSLHIYHESFICVKVELKRYLQDKRYSSSIQGAETIKKNINLDASNVFSDLHWIRNRKGILKIFQSQVHLLCSFGNLWPALLFQQVSSDLQGKPVSNDNRWSNSIILLTVGAESDVALTVSLSSKLFYHTMPSCADVKALKWWCT